MKQIPNILSVSRILLAISLLFLMPFALPFMIIYIVACLTDMFDGLAARRLNAKSKLGATIDAIADHVLVVCIFISVAPVVGVGFWALWLVAAILLFKVCIVAFTIRKYGKAVMSHSYGHKLGATLCFLFPMFSLVIEANVVVVFLGAFMWIIMMEELLIAIKLEQPSPNFKGFLFETLPGQGNKNEQN